MVDKITSPITSIELINKTNEIIDNLGSGGGGASYSATCPAITPVDGVATWVVTHNLDTQAVVTALYSNGNKVEHNTLITSNNAITVTFKASSTVTAGSYKIVVLASGGSGGGSADDTYTSSTLNATLYNNIVNNNGVLSGFTSDGTNVSFAQAPYTISLGTDFEIVFKFKLTSAPPSNMDVYLAGSDETRTLAFYVHKTQKAGFVLGDGTNWLTGDIIGTTTVQLNTDYWEKIVYKNSVASLYLSTDGETYNLENSVQLTGNIPNITMNIGASRVRWNYFSGSIDLNESYVKTNGATIWIGADYSELEGLSPVTDYYVNGSSWYKETFSDTTRTQRIWLEQGGVASSSTATINLLKNFSNTNYVVTGGATNKTTSSFTLTSNANWVAIGV